MRGDRRISPWSPALRLASAEAVAVVLSLIALKLATDMGAGRFAEYAVARRVLPLITFTLLVGTGISVPRFAAAARGTDPTAAANYLGAALLVVLPLALIAAGALLLGERLFMPLLFGTAVNGDMAAAIAVAIPGLCLHVLAHADLRGRMAWRSAFWIHVVNVGAVPVAALLVAGARPDRAVLLTGALWLVISGAFVTSALSTWRPSSAGVAEVLPRLIRFGVPRVPGEFALFGLFSLPVVLVSHTHGLVQAGYLSLALSVLALVTSLFGAAGSVFLPYVSDLMARGMLNAARRTVLRATAGAVLISVLLVLLLLPVVSHLVARYAGSSFFGAIPVMRVILWATVPYVVYLMLRNALDALTSWPHNSMNLLLALSVAVVLHLGGGTAIAPAYPVLGGLITLGVATLLSWWRAAPESTSSAAAQPTGAPSW